MPFSFRPIGFCRTGSVPCFSTHSGAPLSMCAATTPTSIIRRQAGRHRARVGCHGQVASRRALSPRQLQPHQPGKTACEHCRLLQQVRHLRAVDQARQGCYPLDAAVMPVVVSQRAAASASRPRLHVGNVLVTLATPRPIKNWSLTSLKEKPVTIGAQRVSHGRYVTFRLAEVAIPRQLLADILRLIA
jgi:hypothetical protein